MVSSSKVWKSSTRRAGEVNTNFWRGIEKTTKVGTFWSHALSVHSLASLPRSRKGHDCYVGNEFQGKMIYF